MLKLYRLHAADAQLGAAVQRACNVVGILDRTPPLAARLERLAPRPGFQRFVAKANVGMEDS